MRTGLDGGYVTAETAVALPVLVLVALALSFVLGAAGARIRCADAAHAGARAAARGETDPVVTEVARALAPRGARVTVEKGPDRVRVRVVAEIRAPGRVAGGVRVTVTGEAVAAREPGETG